MAVARTDARLVLEDIVQKSRENRLGLEDEAKSLVTQARLLNFLGIVIGVLLGGGIAGISPEGQLLRVGGPILGFASALASAYLFVFNLQHRIDAAFQKAAKYYDSEAAAKWMLLQLGQDPLLLSQAEQKEFKIIYNGHYNIAKTLSGKYADLVGSTAAVRED